MPSASTGERSLFLAESDYIRRMPKQHNMVMVIRDGAHADR